MDRLKTTLGILCSVFVTILLLAVSLLCVNTFVGAETGHIFEPSSALGGMSRILALFFPFLTTFFCFLIGLIFGKYRLANLFFGGVGVLCFSHLIAPFISQFVFMNPAGNGFTRFLQAFFGVLAMPSVSIPYAFNDAVNFFLTDFSGSRIMVFLATFLTFCAPILLTAGFLVGDAAQKKQSLKQEIEA